MYRGHWGSGYTPQYTATFPTVQQVCDSMPITGGGGNPPHTKNIFEWYPVVPIGTQCAWIRYDNMPNCANACRSLGIARYPVVTVQEFVCPAGFVVNTSGGAPTCECPGGTAWDGSQCTKNCLTVGASEAAAYSRTVGTSWLTGPDGQTCGGSGCVWKWATSYKGYDGQWYGANPYPTGQTCGPGGEVAELPAPEDPATDPETPNTCPVGQCPGSINGQSVCVPCSASRETPKETTNTDGSSVTKVTECVNGICSTTETTTSPTGAKSTTVSKESQVDHCSRNPLSVHCSGITNNGDGSPKGEGGEGTCEGTAEECGEEQSSFSGTCLAQFSCEGDAIQCAIALDQHKRHCQAFEDANELSTVASGNMSGEARPDGHPGNAPESVAVSFTSMIDQTNVIGGGCPTDVTITAGVVIPFSAVCGELQLLGNLMVGLTMLAAAFIAFRN